MASDQRTPAAKCARCGNHLPTNGVTPNVLRRYCSAACRQAAYRRRHQDPEPAPAIEPITPAAFCKALGIPPPKPAVAPAPPPLRQW